MIAKKVLEELNIDDVSIVGIAKGADRKGDDIFILNRKNPVKFKKGTDALNLLIKARDEAHRFGIEFYRLTHRKALLESNLDKIDGIGKARKNLLLRTFGSTENIKQASTEDLTNLKGITKKIANNIKKYL